MSFQAGSITGTIDLDGAPGRKALATIEGDATRAGKNIAGAMNNAATETTKSWKATLSDIKGDFGKGSALGQSLKLAMGGGAIAGVNMAAHEVEALTDSVAKASDAMREGKMSGSEMAGQMLRSVPILGTLTKSFDNLREAATGEKYEIDLINEQARITTAFFDAQTEAANHARMAFKEFAAEKARALGGAAIANTDDPLAKQVMTLRMGQDAQISEDQKQLEAALAQAKGDSQKKIDLANAALKRDQTEFDNKFTQVGEGSNKKYLSTSINGQSIDEDNADAQAYLRGIEADKKFVVSQEQQQQKDLDAVRTAGKEVQLAHDVEWNAKIQAAQRDAGKEMRTEAEKDAKAAGKAQVDAWRDQIKVLTDAQAEAAEQMRQNAEEITKALRTPGEVFADKQAELARLYQGGLITKETLKRGLVDAYKGVSDQTTPNPGRVMAEEALKGTNRVVTPADTASQNSAAASADYLKRIYDFITRPDLQPSSVQQVPDTVSMGGMA